MINTTIIIVFIVVGLPVICLTKLIMMKMQQNQRTFAGEDEQGTAEAMKTIASLQHRIENLETIIFKNERYR